ncbi:TIGR00730 family Rossman fold protein [Prevotella melaninogenica]|uniref:LOG family protein n=1 Tax=Prevotella TaxID=838 RepID=UPI0003AD4346|nr:MULTISPECIES: TIGR00730 family Rossman fold protein [Prevotella]ERJ74924.1 TIGR00730 family protein [Prevotella sp. F0091]QUB74293.1 TIGR00730 family Rossman fold protein [Prevotella melaninogenica]
MNIAVFCSANNNIDPDYFRAAEVLGRWIGANGHTLVYGGGNSGLMECIGKAVHEAGGRTVGVIPRIMEEGRRVSDYVDVEIPCEDLSDRKAIMMERSDEFYALPGGIGTIDEVFTVASAATIGYHHKKVTLCNVKGFWDSLITLLNDHQQKGMIRGEYHDYIEIKSIDDFNR